MTSNSSCNAILLQTIIIFLLLEQLSNRVNGAKAMYVFGDSYLDTGNSEITNDGLAWNKPYGIAWPGYPSGRFSNGKTQTDYVAEYLKVPSPTPFRLLKNATNFAHGVNFAVGGAGITYAWAHATLHTQVNEFEALLKSTTLTNGNLKQSVAFIGIGLNDYDTYHDKVDAIPAWIDIIIDGLVYNIWRINKLGIKNIIVTNIAPLACVPLFTYIINFTKCIDNEKLTLETTQHNALLVNALQTLQKHDPEIHIILLNQTYAFNYILQNGSSQGFVNSTIPCCKGSIDSNNWKCGSTNENGDPLYEVCSNPNTLFWWDHGHPSEAGWKVVIELYWSKLGFTHFDTNLLSWIKRYNI